MLEELGLIDCQNTLVGDALTKGISGGERKRTSIGVELVTSPDLIFLDEPTSGLDSYAAWKCVLTLKKLSVDDNATVLATIHQPSSEIFQQFNNVIVLGKLGLVLYSGPVPKLASHLSTHGYPLPFETNPSDHALFVIMTQPITEQISNGLYDKTVVDKVDLEKTETEESVEGYINEGVYVPLIEASFFKQFRWLLKRECR